MSQRLKSKGEQRERCELLARELERAESKVFELGLGDLRCFGMDDGITESGEGESPSEEWQAVWNP